MGIKHNKKNDKKFEDLMSKFENDRDSNFTLEEVEFLGEYNLKEFCKKFPGIGNLYIKMIE